MSTDILPDPAELRERPEAAFLEIIRPHVTSAVTRLRSEVQRLIDGVAPRPFDPATVVDLLYISLPPRLLEMMLRTMTLELHVARLQGLLTGSTAGERFQSFIKRLRQPEFVRTFYSEYPVLEKQVVIGIENWLVTSIEFLERWCTDWPAIRTALSPAGDPGPLVDVQADAGDSHRGGRSVLIARCQSGFQVVYKPKALAVDRHFQELLSWLNARGVSTPFRQLTILDRGLYGWIEFVSPAGCSSADQVERFYRREGGYLALLYALAAADFHYENVIAAGEHPVLIDLEALFHPRDPADVALPADLFTGTVIEASVIGCGLLPLPIRLSFDVEALDLSGAAAEPGAEVPWRRPAFTGFGTDEMQFSRQKGAIDTSYHRATLNGVLVKPLDYLSAFEAGFSEVYRLLEKHHRDWTDVGGLLDQFAGDEVRVVLRPTSRYREFLDEGFHPDVLRDASDRNKLFDRLRGELQNRPWQTRLVPSEIEDLWRNDIPFFCTRPGSHDLYDSEGRRFTDVFPETGLERVRHRLANFGPADFDRQLWFLRASLTTLISGRAAVAQPGYTLDETASLATRERLLTAARNIADRLAECAIYGEPGDVNWIGLSLIRDERWSLLPLGMDLYDGVPGVTLFLAYLGQVTGDERYTSLVRAALKSIRRRLQPHKRLKTVRCLGGFAGWGGVFYTLAHLGTLWDDPSILAEAHELVALLPRLIEQDERLDIMAGTAGCIVGLLCLHGCLEQLSPDSGRQELAAACLCGEHLLSRARAMPRGLGWAPAFPARGPLAGYPYGAAGIATALLELGARTDDERFRSAGRAAIEYERNLFSAERGDWPDLRTFDESSDTAESTSPHYETTWCHGAPGIGLARIRCLPYLNDEVVQEEIETALRITIAAGFGQGHILCHGDMGNLDLLLEAVRLFPNSPCRGQVERFAAGILNSIERYGWLCGNPMRLESPGLMTGIAGIGYGLLRLAEPSKVPSGLSLAPPRPECNESRVWT
jgi:type 2 lantibiotic biosynthesis protein LanM